MNVARVDEVESQSLLRGEEAQVSTLTGFDRNGLARELGHVEEADSPNIYNQIESYYQRLPDGGDQFLTSVIEKILLDNAGKEYFRVGTIWCNSDKYRLAQGMEKLLYNDKYEFSQCTGSQRPLASYTDSWGKQLFTGRSNSDVQVLEPGGGGAFQYYVNSDVSILWNEGTNYKLQKEKPGWLGGEQNYTFIDSTVYQDMGNQASVGSNYYSWNYPKTKFVQINWSRDKDFKPTTKTSQYIQSRPEHFALLAYEKMGEVPTQINGQYCDFADYGKYADADIERLSSRTAWVTCNRAKRHVLHYYIMFPPTVNGAALSLKGKMDILDQALATMPDQTQTSPELAIGEEFGDQIRALELVAATGSPEAIDLSLLVDLNTEEDSLTAQAKIWDFFARLGSVKPRRNLVEVPENKPVQPPAKGGNDDF